MLPVRCTLGDACEILKWLGPSSLLLLGSSEEGAWLQPTWRGTIENGRTCMQSSHSIDCTCTCIYGCGCMYWVNPRSVRLNVTDNNFFRAEIIVFVEPNLEVYRVGMHEAPQDCLRPFSYFLLFLFWPRHPAVVRTAAVEWCVTVHGFRFLESLMINCIQILLFYILFISLKLYVALLL